MKPPGPVRTCSRVLVLLSLLAIHQTTTAQKVASVHGCGVSWGMRERLGSGEEPPHVRACPAQVRVHQCVCQKIVQTSRQALPQGPYWYSPT